MNISKFARAFAFVACLGLVVPGIALCNTTAGEAGTAKTQVAPKAPNAQETKQVEKTVKAKKKTPPSKKMTKQQPAAPVQEAPAE